MKFTLLQASGSSGLDVGSSFILLIILFIYFLPIIVGWKKRNAGTIFVINLFLGWTFIGWVVAFAWAVSYEKPNG